MKALFFLLPFLLIGCNKPDPHPEVKDPIFMDMQSELGATEKNLSEAQKNLDENKQNLQKVAPQTGQIHYAQKRVDDSERIIDALEQQKKYWTIRLDSRRDYVRRKSIEAFQKGETWSDPKEFEEYLTEKRFRQARQQWDARKRREQFLEAEKGISKVPGEQKGGE